MDKTLTIFPAGPGGEPPGEDRAHEAARRSLLRRLLALLAVGGTAFALTTWTLVRFPNPFGVSDTGGEAASVVKAHLEALERGELRAAYEMFSPRYRERVSFEAYHELVVTHRQIFNVREFRLSRNEEAGGRALLETNIVSKDGERYVARFTLVRAEGRWWIDDLRWRGASGGSSVITV